MSKTGKPSVAYGKTRCLSKERRYRACDSTPPNLAETSRSSIEEAHGVDDASRRSELTALHQRPQGTQSSKNRRASPVSKHSNPPLVRFTGIGSGVRLVKPSLNALW